MSTKDISDVEVVQACVYYQSGAFDKTALGLLEEATRQPTKVCNAAMERAALRGLIDCGVSLRTAWPTDKGLKLLEPA